MNPLKVIWSQGVDLVQVMIQDHDPTNFVTFHHHCLQSLHLFFWSRELSGWSTLAEFKSPIKIAMSPDEAKHTPDKSTSGETTDATWRVSAISSGKIS